MATLRLAQITDCHITATPQDPLLGMHTLDSLQAVLADISATPDGLLATGDIAAHGEDQSYRHFTGALEGFDCPVLAIPGNHDLSAPFVDVLMDEGGLNAASTLTFPHWHVIGIDTHVDDEVGGRLDEQRLADLSGRIDAVDVDAHVLVVGHHCPLETHTPWLDKDRIEGSEALLGLLAAKPGVRGYVCGHIHQELDQEIDGLRILGTPSTCFQFAPGTHRFTLDDKPPGYRWLDLHADGTIETGVARLVGYEPKGGGGANA